MGTQQDQEYLLAYMKQLSKTKWKHAWCRGLEYIFWASVMGTDVPYETDPLAECERMELMMRARRAGGWWYWSMEEAKPVFIPMMLWLIMFVDRNTNL